jgi:hypothetical protein
VSALTPTNNAKITSVDCLELGFQLVGICIAIRFCFQTMFWSISGLLFCEHEYEQAKMNMKEYSLVYHKSTSTEYTLIHIFYMEKIFLDNKYVFPCQIAYSMT